MLQIYKNLGNYKLPSTGLKMWQEALNPNPNTNNNKKEILSKLSSIVR
jgi:hypothetical protein